MTSKLGAFAKSAVCIAALAGPAAAGSLSDPVVEAPVSAASAPDWQGLRLGLTYNAEIAGHTYATSEGFPYLDTGNTGYSGFGGFIGYDVQRGNIIYGVELQGLDRENPVQGAPTRIHKDLYSLRGRIGYVQGNALYYGALGLARSTFDDGGSDIDMNGYVAGFGVERKIGKSTFVGLGVDHYVLSGERSANAVEAEHTVLQLRVGFTF